jgi:hypothetical protein
LLSLIGRPARAEFSAVKETAAAKPFPTDVPARLPLFLDAGTAALSRGCMKVARGPHVLREAAVSIEIPSAKAVRGVLESTALPGVSGPASAGRQRRESRRLPRCLDARAITIISITVFA